MTTKHNIKKEQARYTVNLDKIAVMGNSSVKMTRTCKKHSLKFRWNTSFNGIAKVMQLGWKKYSIYILRHIYKIAVLVVDKIAITLKTTVTIQIGL